MLLSSSEDYSFREGGCGWGEWGEGEIRERKRRDDDNDEREREMSWCRLERERESRQQVDDDSHGSGDARRDASSLPASQCAFSSTTRAGWLADWLVRLKEERMSSLDVGRVCFEGSKLISHAIIFSIIFAWDFISRGK